MSENKEPIARYYARNARNFRTSVRVNDVKTPIHFDQHVFATSDEAIITALDNAISEGGLGLHVQKLNMAAAAMVVEKHKTLQAAAKGGTHSLVMANVMAASETQQVLSQLQNQAPSDGLQLVKGTELDLPPQTETINFNDPANVKDVVPKAGGLLTIG